MIKLSVNLLPREIIIQRTHNSKILFINKLSIVALVLLVFFTSSAFTIRFAQSKELSGNEKNLALAQEKVTGQQVKEQNLIFLKQRLDTIKTLKSGDTKIKTIFALVAYLLPGDIQVTTASVDKAGNMSIALNSPSLLSLETLISNLGDREKNNDLIERVDMDSLYLGRESMYKVSLKITQKK